MMVHFEESRKFINQSDLVHMRPHRNCISVLYFIVSRLHRIDSRDKMLDRKEEEIQLSFFLGNK